MKLPRFPIRKSLIPYEDLGIQDVSPDNQILGDDISIIIAAIEAMGKHGARMLQVDDNGNLYVHPTTTSSFKRSGKRFVLGNYHVAANGDLITNLDLSDFQRVNIFSTVSNYDNIGTQYSVVLNQVDDLDNFNTIGTLIFSTTDTYGYLTTGMDNDLFILTDNMKINVAGLITGKSFDLHIYIIGV